MKPPILTFFNNTGGVGKTSLVYHLAWMYASLDKRVVVVDLNPQSNLTAAFLTDEELAKIWQLDAPAAAAQALTVYQCVKPLTGVGNLPRPQLQTIATNLYLLPGDVDLSGYEAILSTEWPHSMGEKHLYRPMRLLSSFWQMLQAAASETEAELVLVDIASNLSAINRSALIATDYVVMPLGAELFSLQGLKNLGPTLTEWKRLWQQRLHNWQQSRAADSDSDLPLPAGQMQPIGYLCQPPNIKLDRPVQVDDKWLNRIPKVYRQEVLQEDASTSATLQPVDDPYCLATVKHYRSLIPMGQEHRKPIFNLTPADGAIGSHAYAVQVAKKDFKQLAEKIAAKISLPL